MDEIEFRGKSVITQDWIYGYYFNDGSFDYILPSRCDFDDISQYEIEKGSQGQFINKTDSNGNRIYVGDILSEKENTKWSAIWMVKHPNFGYKTDRRFIIGNVFDAMRGYLPMMRNSRLGSQIRDSWREWLSNRGFKLEL